MRISSWIFAFRHSKGAGCLSKLQLVPLYLSALRADDKIFMKYAQEVIAMIPKVCTLRTCLVEIARLEPKKRVLGDKYGWLNARETLELSDAVSTRLWFLGVRPGTLIGLHSVRSVDCALLILGLEAIGAIAVLTSPFCEIGDFLASCSTPIPIMAEIYRDAKADTYTFHDILTDRKTAFLPRKLPREFPHHCPPKLCDDPKSPGFVIFTSGSTGKSRAVVLSQYNLINNLIDSHPLGYYCKDDIALGALPLEHVFGLVLLAGAVVLHYAIYFTESTDVPTLLASIESERITRMNGVTSLYLAMADRSREFDLSSLRAGFIGGASWTPKQFHKIEASLGITLIPVYGMSECIGISCASYLDPSEKRSGCVGRFYSMNNGKILSEDGSESPQGTVGEIYIGGPSRMLGYYGETLGENDLIPTGDLGYLDDLGLLHITGRKKEIIICNGNNLSPLRIEQALLSLPGVSAAAVVGLPDEAKGEVPWAMIVYPKGTVTDLHTPLKKLLTKNELPAGILPVDVLPMTTSGKPDKQTIREVLGKWIKS
jgi:fatty-acyl-CoA synthase